MRLCKPSKPLLRSQELLRSVRISLSSPALQQVLERGLLGLLGLQDGARTPKTTSKPDREVC